jgi:hypothetical protein
MKDAWSCTSLSRILLWCSASIQTIYLLYSLVVLGNEKWDNSSCGNGFGIPRTAHVVCFCSYEYSLYIFVHVTSHDDGLPSYTRYPMGLFFFIPGANQVSVAGCCHLLLMCCFICSVLSCFHSLSSYLTENSLKHLS